jgi:ADP-heptose:LPS heptosyltransferase
MQIDMNAKEIDFLLKYKLPQSYLILIILRALAKIKYIIRKRAMGDVLWIEPIIRALAKTHRKLIVHTKFNSLFENYPLPNVLFKSKLSFFEKCLYHIEKRCRSQLFSTCLDDVYEKDPGIHFLHAYQKYAGLPLNNEYPQLHLSAKEKEKVVPGSKYVVLHIESFSAKSFRSVEGIDWNKIVLYFRNRGYGVVQLSLKNDVLANTIWKPTSLREMMSLIYNASYFVGIDSGPSHFAASLGIPSLIIFGSINPALRHFPELFRGILLKQACDPGCTTYDVAHIREHTCNSLTTGLRPRCCVYTTETVIRALNNLEKNVSENNQ